MRLTDLVGSRLVRVRGERDPRAMAVDIGVNVSTLYRWEGGSTHVPHERFLRVAEVYGRPWHVLFDPQIRPDDGIQSLSTTPTHCPTCGQPVDPVSGECLDHPVTRELVA